MRRLCLLFTVLLVGCSDPAIEDNGSLNEAELRERLLEIQSIGYVAGVREAGEDEGVAVVHHDRDQAWEGYNLTLSYGKSEAVLMDMEGQAVHVWRKHLDEIWEPEKLARSRDLTRWEPGSENQLKSKDSWQDAYLMPDGGVIALLKDIGIVSLDRYSNTRWSRVMGVHHMVHVANDGRILTLTSEPRVLPLIDPEEPQLDDQIVILSPEGDELHQISIYDALADSEFASIFDDFHSNGDPFHTNSIQVFESIPARPSPLPEAFKPGALLVSVRQIDLIGVIDPEEEVFTWIQQGPWKQQHDAQLIENGTITLFDNLGHESSYGPTRALEFDPANHEIVWEFVGTPERKFFSKVRGNVQRLPNGNTLINESDAGRAFEVTPDGNVVWEFINPHRAQDQSRLVAAIRKIARFDPGYVESWLEKTELEATPSLGGHAEEDSGFSETGIKDESET